MPIEDLWYYHERLKDVMIDLYQTWQHYVIGIWEIWNIKCARTGLFNIS